MYLSWEAFKTRLRIRISLLPVQEEQEAVEKVEIGQEPGGGGGH